MEKMTQNHKAQTKASTQVALSAKDFDSGQEVRWCAGCGDYAILKSFKVALAQIGTPQHNVVCVSGIGCAARLPYYVNSYGFHTIHGRALPIASGIRMASQNRDLDIWCISGDGDALSIGATHLMHALKRDLNLQLMIFNNQIYGLTKGQASPTSVIGTKSPTSIAGVSQEPLSAGNLTLAANGSFFARAIDIDQQSLPAILVQAQKHQGTAVVEILQNCPIYNDNAFGKVNHKNEWANAVIFAEKGKPLTFGSDDDKKALTLNVKDNNSISLDIISKASDADFEKKALIHDPSNKIIAQMLLELAEPSVMGIIYQKPRAQSKTASPKTPALKIISRKEALKQMMKQNSWKNKS